MTEAISDKKVEHKNIYAALSAFQGELQPMEKKGEVEFKTNNGQTVKFAYTPLGDIMKAIYPLLGKHGLAIRHEITEKGVEAVLTHETFCNLSTEKLVTTASSVFSKEYEFRIENEIRSGVVKVAQAGQMKDVGAAITYARRYTLSMVLGISSEEDKDATLLEQSAKNAIQFAYGRAKKGIEEAKTLEEVDKAIAVIKRDAELLLAGKAPALGLTIDQYEELTELGKAWRRTLSERKSEHKVETDADAQKHPDEEGQADRSAKKK